MIHLSNPNSVARQQAIDAGKQVWIPIKPCKREHLTERSVNNNICRTCNHATTSHNRIQEKINRDALKPKTGTPIICDDGNEYSVIYREEAIKNGLLNFFTGLQCAKRHLMPRLTSVNRCLTCCQVAAQKDRPQARQRANSYRQKDMRRELWRRARQRAVEKGLPFDITIDDIIIPAMCPVLNIPIIQGTGKIHDNSPNLDRIVPELGYVKGNIHVISFRANRIKTNANPNELMIVALYFQKLENERLNGSLPITK